jgi:hypothetical protein
MGSNFSQLKRLAAVMVQPIGHFQGWRFEIGCDRCREKRTLTVERLLISYAGNQLCRPPSRPIRYQPASMLASDVPHPAVIRQAGGAV